MLVPASPDDSNNSWGCRPAKKAGAKPSSGMTHIISNFKLSTLNFLFFLLLSFSSLFLSCKTSKETAKLPDKKFDADSILAELEKNSISFDWFSAKTRVNYEDKSVSKSFNASIRMRKDSVIWISVTTIMGVEAARLLIRDDSVFVMDKLNKKYQAEHLSFLEQYFPFPLEVGLIQKILVGDAMPAASDKSNIRKEKNSYVLFSENKYYRHTINFNADDLTISTEHLVDRQNDRSLSLTFDDYKTDDRGVFSYARKINFSGNEKVRLVLKFSKIKWNEPQSFPFHVGEKYKQN